MASRSLLSASDSPPVNGTELQQLDLFQNLEKLIASAVSICRLDGSVQCQIGGLITVIEELQRLLRHNFAEIKRLERLIEDQKYISTRLEGNCDEQKNALTRLDRNIEDQEHMFTNNITNLHYEVKGVQAQVDSLKIQMREAAEKISEVSLWQNKESEKVNYPVEVDHGLAYGEELGSGSMSNKLEAKSTEKVDDPAQVDDGLAHSEEMDTGSISNKLEAESTEKVDDPVEVDAVGYNEGLSAASSTHNTKIESTGKYDPSHQVDDSCGDREGLHAVLISQNLEVDRTREADSSCGGLSEHDEGATKPDEGKEEAVDTTDVTEATSDCGPSLDEELVLGENNGTSPVRNQVPFPESPPQAPVTTTKLHSTPVETVTVTSEGRGNALRVLRSSSKSTSKSSNPRLTRSLRNEDVSRRSSSSPIKSRHSKSPLAVNSMATKKTSPRKKPSPRAVLGKPDLIRNANKISPSRKSVQKSQRRRVPPKTSKGASFSKDKKSPVTLTAKRRTKSPNKIQKSAKLPRKRMNSNVKGNAKVIQKLSPNKNTRISGRLSTTSASKTSQLTIVSSTTSNKVTANDRASKRETTNQGASGENSASKKAPVDVPLSETNPMEKYINLDFVLNANQLMSELVSDSSREEGTLDTASEAERRDILKLAKLYRLRVRMAGKEGELPVALIKGRESSLPEPGQVDRLLYQMTRAMIIKRQVVKAKESMKRNISRHSMPSPAKKRRV